MAKILIADDEKEIVRLLKMYLETDDITVLEANDGIQALEIVESENVDLALVDIMMPKMDGYQLIKKIRQKNEYIPIIVISAKVTLSDRVLGIDLGADDYITKPFEPLEVAAKVKAQLRRLNATTAKAETSSTITVGDITLDIDECRVSCGGESIELTKAELKVLELLMSQPKRVFTKEQIYESAWYSDTAADDNTIRVIISRLRDKVGAEHIKTIRGLGYRFEA
ncbi:MAG: response regulator transcription factor [Lachnospiraceae bacterium]|nr:response regulator transcription factor [Lachnospiraceae bacterium]